MITLSMLRFCQIIKGLPSSELIVKTKENEEVKIQFLEVRCEYFLKTYCCIERFQERIKNIEEERRLQSMIMNSDLSTNITTERMQQMQNVTQEYLTNKTNEIVLANVTDIHTVLRILKNLYNQIEVQKKEEIRKAYEKAYTDALEKLEMASARTPSIISSKVTTIIICL